MLDRRVSVSLRQKRIEPDTYPDSRSPLLMPSTYLVYTGKEFGLGEQGFGIEE